MWRSRRTNRKGGLAQHPVETQLWIANKAKQKKKNTPTLVAPNPTCFTGAVLVSLVWIRATQQVSACEEL